MKVKLFRHKDKPGSAKAYLFQRIDKKEVKQWIPKSVISDISQISKPDTEGFMIVVAEVEDWFAEQNGL